ncbi:hypothetical protein [Candidatus Nitrosocosmicus sp. FF01]|uniref:hypothetical protein n=1 Tax=Candidatus Nitrosocosmicus sp. FF01 TaxID=3397670 RepID=UPI0039E8E148
MPIFQKHLRIVIVCVLHKSSKFCYQGVGRLLETAAYADVLRSGNSGLLHSKPNRVIVAIVC